MNYYIITGTSRGLGAALAKELLRSNNHLFCISRSRNRELEQSANSQHVGLNYYEFDLTEFAHLENLMRKIINRIDKHKIESLTLINNAGVIEPMKPIDKSALGEIVNNLHINLVSPILLTSQFIRLANRFQVPKKVCNISSGAGKKPYYGWSSYCASKAGLDLFTQSVAMEQEKQENPVRMVAIAPGVMDTGMQEQIRATREDDFAAREKFIKLKQEGQLIPPNQAAKVILDILIHDKFEPGMVLDVRDFI